MTKQTDTNERKAILCEDIYLPDNYHSDKDQHILKFPNTGIDIDDSFSSTYNKYRYMMPCWTYVSRNELNQ